jgi:hypothetical protein
MGQNMSQVKANIQKSQEIEAQKKALKNINVSENSQQNMDAIDQELNQLLESYSAIAQASTLPVNTGSNAKERYNFYVADFTDGAYYTTDHIIEKGPYKDAPNRAMNITIDDAQWQFNKNSCSQACKDHKYFALQDVNNDGYAQCFCSDSWEETSKYGSAEGSCQPSLWLEKLYGDSRGGPWCNYVYENVKPPPIPSTMHLGKMYYAEKGLKEKKYTIYEYPKNQIDFTGQDGVEKINFFEVNNFDSPGYTKTSKNFDSLNAAKQYCLEIQAVGFTHNRNTNEYQFKSSIFPQTKKVVNDNVDFYIVVPAIKNAEPCNKSVTVVSPTLINSNCVLKNGIPPSNVCDGLNANTETGLGSINDRLMVLGRSLATTMQQNMENTAKYNEQQPKQREKYQKTIAKYEKVMKAIKGQKATIVTEDAIMSDSMKNIQMRKIFIFILFAIVGTAAILYLFSNSIMIAVIVLIIYYIALYLLMVVKQNNNDY